MASPKPTNDVRKLLVEFSRAGRSFAAVSVLKDAGSTPRKAGTRAIVEEGGRMWGTIGGGLLEAEAKRLALEAIGKGRATVFDFRFNGTDPCGGDPVCGGTMRVLVDPSAPTHRAAYERMADALGRRRRGVLLTKIERERAADVEVRWFETGVGDEMPEEIAAAFARMSETDEAVYVSDDRSEALAERVLPTPLLLVAGGGHVGQALAQQARLAGFDVVVVEDRAEYADAARYEPEVMTRGCEFAAAIDEFGVTEDTYIAIVGRGHLVDAKALAACIHRAAAYIGMMGSRRKIALLRKEFIDSGKATRAEFDRVWAPIGLDIGAQTVPEIAVSIVAQLIAVRRGQLRASEEGM
jgi:xanthine dehydrogenase accessory factor